jgi:hypothetical protein
MSQNPRPFETALLLNGETPIGEVTSYEDTTRNGHRVRIYYGVSFETDQHPQTQQILMVNSTNHYLLNPSNHSYLTHLAPDTWHARAAQHYRATIYNRAEPETPVVPYDRTAGCNDPNLELAAPAIDLQITTRAQLTTALLAYRPGAENNDWTPSDFLRAYIAIRRHDERNKHSCFGVFNKDMKLTQAQSALSALTNGQALPRTRTDGLLRQILQRCNRSYRSNYR